MITPSNSDQTPNESMPPVRELSPPAVIYSNQEAIISFTAGIVLFICIMLFPVFVPKRSIESLYLGAGLFVLASAAIIIGVIGLKAVKECHSGKSRAIWGIVLSTMVLIATSKRTWYFLNSLFD